MEPIPHALDGPLSRRTVLGLLGAGASALLVGCAAPPAGAGIAEDPRDVRGFLAAVERGDVDEVARRLDADGRLARAADDAGRSAFVLAHLAGHPRVAELLARRGLELDVVEAVLAADWERVEELAAADPRVMNAAHPIGGSPLYASGLVGGGEQYRLRALGCDSNGRPPGGSGRTPARAAMDCRDPLGAWLAATDILSNGGDVNAPQAGGDSVLHGAVKRRDTRLVRLVLRKGGDPGARDASGRTPLDFAEALDWAEGAALLRDPGAVPRDHRASRLAFDASREPFELLPLTDVAQEVQSRITGLSHFDAAAVREMLEGDPRLVHAVSTDEEVAVEACGHTGRRDILRLHLDRGAPLSLPTAFSAGELEHARWLLARDPRLVHERGPHDFPVMWYPAIGGDSVEAAELLLDAGAPLEQESGGETALHHAAMRGRTDLVRFLLERGADPRAVGYRQDRAGRTPHELALARGHAEAARLLAEHGGAG